MCLFITLERPFRRDYRRVSNDDESLMSFGTFGVVRLQRVWVKRQKNMCS